MATLKFNFRIIYCSSEDPDQTSQELLDPSINSRGWLSARHCEYPQEMILQFANIVQLKQI
jgi:hypothetical protein